MKINITRILISLLIALSIWAVVIVLYRTLSSSSFLSRVAVAMGGDIMGGGYIQFLLYFFFTYAVLEVSLLCKEAVIETSILDRKILPEEKHKVLPSNQINDLKHKTIDFESNNARSYYLTQLVIKACTKFRSNHSVPEVLETTIRQAQLNLQLDENKQMMLRYIAWVIPSIGFIGTVLGIAGGIGAANGEMETEDIDKVTQLLGLAFDTTLIALILSVVLMLLLHRLQSLTINCHSNIEQYVLDNLINRIEN